MVRFGRSYMFRYPGCVFEIQFFCLQVLSLQVESQFQSLNTLNQLSGKLGSSSSNAGISKDVHSVAERVQKALPVVRETSNRLPVMLECFQHQQYTEKHVAFLKEVRSRLEVEFCLDGVVDAENELSGVQVRGLG